MIDRHCLWRISVEQKKKIMALLGKGPVRDEIVIKNIIMEQVNHFNILTLGMLNPMIYHRDVINKLSEYGRMWRIK